MLCPECRAVLIGTAPSRVRPVPEPSGLPVVHAAARYEDEARAVLLAHKERGALALAAPLGTALAGAVRAGLREARADGGGVSGRAVRSVGGQAVRSVGGQAWALGSGRSTGGAGAPVLLVPVPSARGAVRARGHDPARRIALAAASELRRAGTPARVLAVLRQGRAVADQSELNSRQRLDNLAGALTVAPGGGRLLVGGGPVVLVDDLMTTGASLTEAARALRAAMATGAVAAGSRALERVETSGAERVATSGAEGVQVGAESAGVSGLEGRSVYGLAGRSASGGTDEEVDAYRWGTAEPAGCGDGATLVYRARSRESTGERKAGSTEGAVRRTREMPGIMGTGRPDDLIRAAVVAAPPDSFEINRN